MRQMRFLVCLVLCCASLACGHVGSQNSDGVTITFVAPISDRSEQLLERQAYTVSYNSDTRQPNWVAWRLTAEHTKGTVKRPQNAWHDDKEVAEPRAYFYDYKGVSDQGVKYDHGHLCPAGDNKWDADAMYESFLMTNCCPQNHNLNTGLWNQIEQSCRQWAERYGEVLIVCGPLFLKGEHDTLGQHRIPVPEAFFKVVVCLDPDNPRGIGFICRNSDGNRKKDFYTNSISQVERITGMTFFPALEPAMADKVKSSDDIGQW